MALSKEDRAHLVAVAKEIIATLESVSAAARLSLSDHRAPGEGALATTDRETFIRAMESLRRNQQEILEGLRRLASEPAVARVVAKNSAGKESKYYICRGSSMAHKGVISYLAPIGRLASLSVGDSLEQFGLEVQETAKLGPRQVEEGWDSQALIETLSYGPLTVDSLRELIRQFGREVADLEVLDRLLEEESEAINLLEGRRRGVIDKMTLRDQPTLDKYQDEIFRLPLNRRLLVLGPPGTGKTTTLIRRLGQKLKMEFLDEAETRLVENLAGDGSSPHPQSWLMFSPTELLRQYVREAFNREEIPASDRRIVTWADHRRDLARDDLHILRTPSGRISFSLKDDAKTVRPDAQLKTIEWFRDYDEWQKKRFLDDLRQAANELSGEKDASAARLGAQLVAIFKSAQSASAIAILGQLAGGADKVRDVINGWKGVTDKIIKDSLSLRLNQQSGFLDALVAFLESIRDESSADAEEDDESETDEEEETTQPRVGRAAAAAAYMRAVRAQARSYARSRTLPKQSRNARIIAWIGGSLLPEEDLAKVGASLVTQARARRFANPINLYLRGLGARYRQFRRTRQEEGRWYEKEGFSATDLHPLELDMLILATLRTAQELLTPQRIRNLEGSIWSSLRAIRTLYKNQVIVDEVTDFSPIQIGCMVALTEPQLRSFFACGDFNQRLTRWGARSHDELKWLLPDVEVKQVSVSYRHSRQLHELADGIVRVTGGADRGVSLPPGVNSEGAAPALLEGEANAEKVCEWIAQRVVEIEEYVERLPSIAVFVNGEDKVQSTADQLNALLEGRSIRSVACLEGRVIGRDNDVRVFDLQHIKGLEFEAAFVLGLDQLAKAEPDLFDKYMYVAVTRAATYLGVTCETSLPTVLEPLRPMFVADWRERLAKKQVGTTV